MKLNKYETPEVVVISLDQDVITGSLSIGDTPTQSWDW